MNALLVCAIVTLGQAGEPGDVYQDLRHQQPQLPSLRMTGAFLAKYTIREPEGLRVTLPAKREKYSTIALQTDFRVSGDFEITATYELFAADVPDNPDKPGAVVGVNIYIIQGDDGKRFARVGRFNTQKRGHVYEISHTDRDRENSTTMQRFPTDQWAGQLRFVRKGKALAYLVKDAKTGDDFRELFVAEDFGDDPLKMVRYVVNTTELPCMVDARLIDFRVRSGDLSAAVADPTPLHERRNYWWMATFGGLVVVMIGGLALAGLVRRKKTRLPAVDGHVQEPSAPATPDSTNGVLHVQCPSCQKRLKVPGNAGGKKIKCPECASAFVA
jgi:hypothetical protein